MSIDNSIDSTSFSKNEHQIKHRQYLKKISEGNSIDKNKQDLENIDKEMHICDTMAANWQPVTEDDANRQIAATGLQTLNKDLRFKIGIIVE